jgi:hypothetical protein
MRVPIAFLLLIAGCDNHQAPPQPAPQHSQVDEKSMAASSEEMQARSMAHDLLAPHFAHLNNVKFDSDEKARKQGPNRWFIEGTAEAYNDFDHDMKPVLPRVAQRGKWRVDTTRYSHQRQ